MMAAFSISEAESPLPLQPGASPRSLDASNCRDWEEVSCALLEDGFILTALELHTELLECGREVSTLKDYFSNPGNFEHAIPQPPSSSDLLCKLEKWAWPEIIIRIDPGFFYSSLSSASLSSLLTSSLPYGRKCVCMYVCTCALNSVCKHAWGRVTHNYTHTPSLS